MMLENKVAIVTGSSHGIGKAVALEFAKEGADVVVVGVTAVEAANEVAKQITELGRRAIVLMTDVSDRREVDNLVNTAIREFGRIDILVNNAGIMGVVRFREMTEEQWDRTLEVHLKGTYNCTKAVVEHMIKQGGGRIINVTSMAGLIGGYGQAPYSAAKGGIISLTKALARELARYKITVNAISPGANTRMLEEFKKIPNFYEQVVSLAAHPLGMPEPEDVAPAFAFLASDGGRYITGQVIRVDGGRVIGVTE